MAAKQGNGTLTANTVATETLTGWAPYVGIDISSSVAGVANVTLSGVNPVVGADDTYVVSSGQTIVVRNPTPRAGLQTVDPTYTQLTQPTQAATQVKLISAAALVYSTFLTSDPGDRLVLS